MPRTAGGLAERLTNFCVATLERLEQTHAAKTGALLRGACRLGAIAARATAPQLLAIDDFGRHLGLAFQITDDVLDETASTEQLGKTAGKDRAAGKPTYPAFFGLDRSRELADECRSHARSALERAGLLDSRLADIASWIIDRKT